MVLRNHVTCLNNTRLKVTTTDPNRGLVRACNKPIDESCVINFDHLQYQAIFGLHPQTQGLKPYLATKKNQAINWTTQLITNLETKFICTASSFSNPVTTKHNCSLWPRNSQALTAELHTMRFGTSSASFKSWIWRTKHDQTSKKVPDDGLGEAFHSRRWEPLNDLRIVVLGGAKPQVQDLHMHDSHASPVFPQHGCSRPNINNLCSVTSWYMPLGSL